jgi:hypothetical protein
MRLLLSISVAMLLTVGRSVTAQVDGYQLYLGGHPQAETSWSNDAQGVAHDDNNWYITQTEVIWKIPVHLNLDTVTGTTSGVFRVPLTFYSSLEGFHHTGDLVVHRHNGIDYLLLPLEGPGKPGTIAVFDCATMGYITKFALPLQSGDAGWCATDSNGLIYSTLQHASVLFVYELNWPLLQSSGIAQLTVHNSQPMFDEQNSAIDLVTMQGGEFAPGGRLLYLISGFYDDDNGLEEREGIHVLERSTDQFGNVSWHRVAHSTRGFGHFDFYYDPGFPTYEEPEGLTVWDLDDGRAPGIRGQLHAFVSDNDADAGDIDFKHYTATIRVIPSGGCIPGQQPGTPSCPFQTVTAAASFAWDGSEIRIRTGVYQSPLTVSRRVTLTAENGLVRIGGN